MLGAPDHWRNYYPGAGAEAAYLRHYSFSDRIRYYWPNHAARAAVEQLMLALGDRKIPLPLISQYLGRSRDGVAAGAVAPIARDLILNSIDLVLDDYASAVDAGESASSQIHGGRRIARRLVDWFSEIRLGQFDRNERRSEQREFLVDAKSRQSRNGEIVVNWRHRIAAASARSSFTREGQRRVAI